MTTILVDHDHPSLRRTIAEMAPDLQVVTQADLDADRSLAPEVNVLFGHADEDRVAALPALAWVQQVGAGADKAPLQTLRDRDITLTNASGIHAEPISEHLFAMTLAVLRRLPPLWDAQREATWGLEDYTTGVGMLAGRTLGVLGVGAVGGHSARIGRAFGMRVIGLRRTGEPHPDVEQMHGPSDREAFFATADVVFNTLPLTSATQGFVGRREFAAMPEGCIFTNAGRGGTVDTDALLDGLRMGRPAFACLDVMDPEPLPGDHPLWTTPNVLITPHVSGWHPGYMKRAGAIFVDNLRRWLEGAPLRNVVDLDEGY